MQIDNPDRGFSFKNEGPLDLRLDPSKGETAAERLKELDFEELKGMLVENSDEPYAEQIARKVMNEKKHTDNGRGSCKRNHSGRRQRGMCCGIGYYTTGFSG